MPEKMTEVLAQRAGIAANAIAPAVGNSTRRRHAQGQMESLVSRMESVAQRISARNMSASQRSVLVSRFNDLTRQVNLMDGIVAGEGQEVRGRRALRLGSGLSGPADNADTRRRITTRAGSALATETSSALFARERGPDIVNNKTITAQTVKEIREGIQLRGLAVIGTRRSVGAVLDVLA